MSKKYFTESNDKTDMKKYSRYVKVFDYPSHVESVGISYKRHFNTKSEIIIKIEELKKNKNLFPEGEFEKRLYQLQLQLEERNQVHKPKTRQSTVRSDNIQSFEKSQKNMQNYLYSNFDCSYCYMGTLTNAIKVYDMKSTRKNFEKFRIKFKRMFPDAVWLAYFDFHKDKSTHIHFIFKNAKRC